MADKVKPPDLQKLRDEIVELGDEWRELYNEDRTNPRCRELRRLLGAKSRLLLESEPKVQVDVPYPRTGECFVVGTTKFPPGTYTVPGSVAEMLMWMFDQDNVEDLRIRFANTDRRRMADPRRGDILSGRIDVNLGAASGMAREVE